eukprot:COSAG01_NODE_714_length_14097_cov_6.044435_12_plen_97_part_00
MALSRAFFQARKFDNVTHRQNILQCTHPRQALEYARAHVADVNVNWHTNSWDHIPYSPHTSHPDSQQGFFIAICGGVAGSPAPNSSSSSGSSRIGS